MESISYLTQAEAIAVDEELMGPLGFSVDQLMEIAGLACASALASEYPVSTHPRVLVLAGPGNNGGDGLVAARHLTHFGYSVKVVYPKPTDKPLYNGLVTQCKALGIPFLDWQQLTGPSAAATASSSTTTSTAAADSAASPSLLAATADVVVDALFGFSFRGTPRAPFDAILKALAPESKPPVIVSVDIPSGWDVETGDEGIPGAIQPDMLVSLTAPKLAAKRFKGKHHYLGGRFVPPAIRDKYKLVLPPYPGTLMAVRLGGSELMSQAVPVAQAATPKVSDLRISYERGMLEESAFAGRDPMQVFDEWFKYAVANKVCEEPNAISLATADAEGRPSVRVVLLKGYDERGFVFYTNYNSRKGRELANGHAAFTVYWEATQQQIRVEGEVERVPEAESEAYFHSRPRGSQIGAWVSSQSSVCAGRHELEERQLELSRVYDDPTVPVPKPPHWGGYLLRPRRIEFWQGRPSRLHDRLTFTRKADAGHDVKGGEAWIMERLQP